MTEEKNSFKPYNVAEVPGDNLSLQLNSFQKNLRLFLLRVLPFFLLLLLVFISNQLNDLPDWFRIIYLLATLSAIIILLTRKLILAVDINRYSIQITHLKLFNTTINTFLWNDIEHIECKVIRVRGGGVFYKIVFNASEKILFLQIPFAYINDERIKKMNQQFRQLTGKEVKD